MTEAERRKVEELLEAIDNHDIHPEPARTGSMVVAYDNARVWSAYEVLKKIGLL